MLHAKSMGRPIKAPSGACVRGGGEEGEGEGEEIKEQRKLTNPQEE